MHISVPRALQCQIADILQPGLLVIDGFIGRSQSNNGGDGELVCDRQDRIILEPARGISSHCNCLAAAAVTQQCGFGIIDLLIEGIPRLLRIIPDLLQMLQNHPGPHLEVIIRNAGPG
ncbi:hypothetical protein D3C75_616500 [compost metagenome]